MNVTFQIDAKELTQWHAQRVVEPEVRDLGRCLGFDVSIEHQGAVLRLERAPVIDFASRMADILLSLTRHEEPTRFEYEDMEQEFWIGVSRRRDLILIENLKTHEKLEAPSAEAYHGFKELLLSVSALVETHFPQWAGLDELSGVARTM